MFRLGKISLPSTPVYTALLDLSQTGLSLLQGTCHASMRSANGRTFLTWNSAAGMSWVLNLTAQLLPPVITRAASATSPTGQTSNSHNKTPGQRVLCERLSRLCLCRCHCFVLRYGYREYQRVLSLLALHPRVDPALLHQVKAL